MGNAQIAASEPVTPATSPVADVNASAGHKRLVFCIVSLAILMAAIDQTIVATGLPAIQQDLHASLNWSGWTITIYALGQVLVMPVAGKLSDQFGRKKIFVVSVVLFTAASLCCGFANNIAVLIALRAVQAIGGGAFVPSATGIVADQFGKDRDRAVGMFTSIFPIGGIIGPALGGIFVTYWSWRGIFLINVPIGLLLVVLGIRFIRSEVPAVRGSLDVRGVVLLGIGLLALMLGVSNLGGGGTHVVDLGFWLPELLGLVTLWAFVRHSARHPRPFIAIRLLREREFVTLNTINFLIGGAGLGFGSLVPIYAQDRYGLASLPAGTLLTARAVGMVAVAGLAVMALRRTGYRLPMMVGFAILVAGLGLIAVAPVGLEQLQLVGGNGGGHRHRDRAVPARIEQRDDAQGHRSGRRRCRDCAACSAKPARSRRCR